MAVTVRDRKRDRCSIDVAGGRAALNRSVSVTNRIGLDADAARPGDRDAARLTDIDVVAINRADRERGSHTFLLSTNSPS